MQNTKNFLSINEDEEDKTLSFGELRAKYFSAPDKKGRKEIECFDYYYCPIFINGNGYNAIISVEKTRTAGNLYYHHFLKDIKIEPFSSIPPDIQSNALLLNDS